MTTDLRQRLEQPHATRADLARQLLARIDRLVPRLGEVSLAAEVQLLKRDLVRGHAVLSVRPEDNNYLSVFTLVETALASLTWKGYTPGVLEALPRAFSAGLHEEEVTYEEYDALRRQSKASAIPNGPTIDLTSLGLEEDEDGPQA